MLPVLLPTSGNKKPLDVSGSSPDDHLQNQEKLMTTERSVKNGITEWRVNGKLHREDGPAIEYANGAVEYWYFDGKLHREDGPAVTYANGEKFWYVNGDLKKVDKPTGKCTEAFLRCNSFLYS